MSRVQGLGFNGLAGDESRLGCNLKGCIYGLWFQVPCSGRGVVVSEAMWVLETAINPKPIKRVSALCCTVLPFWSNLISLRHGYRMPPEDL